MASRRKGPPRSTPTLQQVARVAGVSIATASRVVTGTVPVSPDRRARVEQAVALLGYVPDERARDLRRNAQKAVGLIIPSLASPLYGAVFRILHRQLQDDGFTLLAFESDADRESERAAVEVLVRSHARAVIVAAATGLAPEIMQLLRRRDIRVIFFDDRPPEPGATCVCVDDRAGARLLTEHLVGLGHTRIALLSGALDGSTGVDRHAGYIEALDTAGIAPDPELVRAFDWTLAAGQRATAELLDLASPPTALLAVDPVLAAGALVEVRERRLVIPDDLSLASFFESDHIRYVDPAITCLTGMDQGIAAALVAALDGEVAPGRIDVPFTPVFRGSTAPPRA
jgi:DNA-binding LacI/PurR family transcriptional regulator